MGLLRPLQRKARTRECRLDRFRRIADRGWAVRPPMTRDAEHDRSDDQNDARRSEDEKGRAAHCGQRARHTGYSSPVWAIGTEWAGAWTCSVSFQRLKRSISLKSGAVMCFSSGSDAPVAFSEIDAGSPSRTVRPKMRRTRCPPTVSSRSLNGGSRSKRRASDGIVPSLTAHWYHRSLREIRIQTPAYFLDGCSRKSAFLFRPNASPRTKAIPS